MGNVNKNIAYAPKTSRNWQLWIGGILVWMVLIIAIFGSNLSPRDPLQENFVIFVDDSTFVKPPFAAFLVPGFPLGSDEFGRDIFSRLLWGVKPTLILVLVTAALRLIAGTVIGIITGWSNNWKSSLLNSLISLSGALPTLFIALCVIAATGQKLGILAFILGLSITGWGDAARLIRDQTRIIRSQLFIEASQALGSTGPQMLGTHLLPQIMPSVWMMLAFEVSSSLLVTAQLGVLGYFINAVWVPIGDFVGLRASGLPELSQMLGNLQGQPWGALGSGLIIFITILGFNLLGEGLRLRASPEYQHRRRSDLNLKISEWVDDRIFSDSASFRRQAPIYLGVVSLFIVAIGGGIYLWQSQVRQALKQIPPLPGNHQWIATYRDSQGTLWTPFEVPSSPKIVWSIQPGGSFSGGPVVDSKGIIYLPSSDLKLNAIAPEGKLLWSVNLPNPPLGYPALTASGLIYIVDSYGGLTQVKPDRSVVEVVKGTSPKSPAFMGPLVAADNAVYYATTDYFYAISPEGAVRWKKSLPTYSLTSPIIRLTRDNQHLIFEDFVILAENGEIKVKASPDPMDRLIVGSNNIIYRLTQAYIEEINPDGNISQQPEQIKWDSRSLGTNFRFPRNSGVTPEGNIWLLFGGIYESSRVVWLDSNGVSLSILDFPFRGPLPIMVAIDKSNTVILCGLGTTEPAGEECRANTVNSTSPLWRIPIQGNAVGGALIQDRLYIATGAGILYAIEDSN